MYLSLLGIWKVIYLYIFLFNDNLLKLNHSIILRSSSFTEDAVLLRGILSYKIKVLNKAVSSA